MGSIEFGRGRAAGARRCARRCSPRCARRWLSTSGALADLLGELTPLATPLPDTGDLRHDLAGVARPLMSPTSNAIVHHIAVDAIETLLAPIYLRLLVTHEPVDSKFLRRLVDRTATLLTA